MTFGLLDLLGVSPLILAVIAALVVITLDIFLGRGDDREIMPMTSVGALVGVGILLALLWNRGAEAFSVFGDQMVVDRFGLISGALCCGCALITVLMAPRYLERAGMEYGEFYGLVLFGLFGMLLMCMGSDLMIVFLAIETMSLALYGLVGMNKRDPRGAEAAIKYFIMGAIGSGFFTFGIALIYAATGTTNIPELTEGLAWSWDVYGSKYLAVPGLALMIVGFCFKLGAVPFHSWVPDVYQGAPTPITGFMASGVKVAAATVFARVLVGGAEFSQTEQLWAPALQYIAGLSMLIGAVVALSQKNLKRMLGYSAISHTGFLFMAFLGGAGSIGIQALVIYLAAYAAATAGAFAILSQLSRADGTEATDIADLKGLARSRPGLAAAMGLFMLSLAGLPGTAGFIGKLSVFSEAIAGGYISLTILAVFLSIVSLGYYLPVIVAMYMQDADAPSVAEEENTSVWGANVAIALCALAILGLGLMPERFIQAAAAASSGVG